MTRKQYNFLRSLPNEMNYNKLADNGALEYNRKVYSVYGILRDGNTIWLDYDFEDNPIGRCFGNMADFDNDFVQEIIDRIVA